MARRPKGSLGPAARIFARALLPIAALGAFSPLAARAAVPYRSPADGARYVLPQAGLIVRPGGRVEPASVPADGAFWVAGSASGRHAGRGRLSDDRRAILWNGDAPFLPGETVTWNLASGARLESGEVVPEIQGTFHVAAAERPPPFDTATMLRAELAESGDSPGAGAAPPLPWDASAPGWSRAPRSDSLPGDFPAIYRTVTGRPERGRIFAANITFANASYPSYLMILEDDGTPVFYKRLNGWGLDFKVQPDGRLTYFDDAAKKFYALDDSCAVVDSFMTGNGYTTDLHELRVLPDGHALLMAYDFQRVDMSQVVPGGDTTAAVGGLIVQEIDRDKNVVFEWRSWDHYEITDATHTDFTDEVIDYAHGNAIEVDTDGNLLLSCRHMDEITKIDRQTGDIVWRWGGKHNEFTFVNDAEGFSHQHAIRRLPNGHVTLFDNGNYHVPIHSRALEYALDESARTATLVWEFRDRPDVVAFAMGYVQRLGGGNTLIGWGSANPIVTEVNALGQKVTELRFDPGTVSYRAYRFPWYPEFAANANARLAAVFRTPRSHPFRKGGVLTVAVRRTTDVTVRMFDVRGRLVRVLLDRARLDPGDHDVAISGSGLKSGVYFCRVRAEGKSDTRKIAFFR